MAISERKYEQMFREAQADAIRFRQQRDAALGWIRAIGRLTADEQIVAICRGAIGGQVPPDTARLDAIERECADIELTCGGVWRVSGVEDYEADSLRGALDKLVEATGKERP